MFAVCKWNCNLSPARAVEMHLVVNACHNVCDLLASSAMCCRGPDGVCIGLLPSSVYDVYCMARDDNGLPQQKVTKVVTGLVTLKPPSSPSEDKE